jgi:hypothetical protein
MALVVEEVLVLLAVMVQVQLEAMVVMDYKTQ